MRRSFEAIGEEALSPPVDQRSVSAFTYQEAAWPHVTLQFGGRVERASFSPDEGLPSRDFTNVSGSLGVLFRPSDQTTVAVSLARAVRNPALEELYFFGPHAGNFSFEIGNPDLEAERALGVDVAFRWRLAHASGEVVYFRNRIDNFIFRSPTGEIEEDLPGEEDTREGPSSATRRSRSWSSAGVDVRCRVSKRMPTSTDRRARTSSLALDYVRGREVGHGARAHRLRRGERDDLALGAAADGPRDVELRRHGRSARENEVLERTQLGAQAIHERLERVHVSLLDPRHGSAVLVLLGDAEVGAQVEELVLDPGQSLSEFVHRPRDEGDADARVELVHGAVRPHPHGVLRDAPAAAQPGGPVVAASRV